jgi:deoxyribodipyrimidine photo-lyase
MSFLRGYGHARDLPALHGTSRLSAHHACGTVSIRETFAAAHVHRGAGAQQFIAELYWRDFYYHIAYHFPHVFGHSFLPWGDRLAWRHDPAALDAWQRGETGVPIVDAGMRELNETGWMHNRVRMVVASFLTKNLLMDWRDGEQYFARRLLDYDPAVNNGSWQWAASVGADPRPLRIFNPYTQAQKYDPHADYIRRWVPELAAVPAHLLTDGKERDFSPYVRGYPSPIVSCRETFHRAREAYASAKVGTRGGVS